MANEVDPVILRKLLRYEPETGKLYWLEREREMFSTKRSCTLWNLRYAGREALAPKNASGYKFGSVLGVGLLAHRVIWAWLHGEWPEQIDHINGDRSDNRPENLRRSNYSINAKNHCRRCDNTTGVTGVYWNKSANKWQAGINHQGRWRFLGYYRDQDQAIAARKAAERELGFHPNHGRAAA